MFVIKFSFILVVVVSCYLMKCNSDKSEGDHHNTLHHQHGYLMHGSYLHDITKKREIMADNFYNYQLQEREIRFKKTQGHEIVYDYVNSNFICLFGSVPIGGIDKDSTTNDCHHKYICGLDHINGSPIVYTFGSNHHFIFERSILSSRPDSKIHIFQSDSSTEDPIDTIHVDHEQFTIHSIGLGTKNSDNIENPMTSTLKDIMLKLNHTYVDILIIDIQGNEHKWIEIENPKIFSRVGQLLIKIYRYTEEQEHINNTNGSNNIHDRNYLSNEVVMQSIYRLEQEPFPSLRIFHKENDIIQFTTDVIDISLIQPYWINWNLEKESWGSVES